MLGWCLRSSSIIHLYLNSDEDTAQHRHNTHYTKSGQLVNSEASSLYKCSGITEIKCIKRTTAQVLQNNIYVSGYITDHIKCSQP